jgi:hypothetical protein
MHEKVEKNNRCEMKLVLYFWEVGVSKFDETDEWSLSNNVEDWPFDIMVESFLFIF